MVNRKLKKKTLKKKSKNKTKKKYMNRRDIENLFMMSSFQRGGVDLHGGGPKERLQGLTRQIAHGPKFQFNEPQPEQPPDWLTGTRTPKPSSMGLPKFVNKNTTVGSTEQPERRFTSYVPKIEETDVSQETDNSEETDCNTLLQELTEMLENIINEFNSP